MKNAGLLDAEGLAAIAQLGHTEGSTPCCHVVCGVPF